MVPLEPTRSLAARFHAAHAERFGFADPSGEVELVAVRAARVAAGPGLPRPSGGAAEVVAGPRSVPMAGATLWVAEGWVARAAADGGWTVTR
jgi:N-methylhydantoinase A/oxoprolinase/acetone carboxylase beta subunit